MTKQLLIYIFITTLFVSSCKENKPETEVKNEPNTNLKSEIENIISTKKADIGISIIHSENEEIVEINGDKHYPMLSTVKFPIALAILSKIEKGELKMSQEIFIKKEELLQNTWSPFREKFPEGNTTISLEEALNWMVIYSDNNITDILLRLIDGTKSVEKSVNDNRFIIKNNEEDMHKNWESQFVNKTTSTAFAQLLKKFSEEKIVNKANTEWLYQAMVNSETGLKRLKGKLPNVKIAQRAGTSFTNEQGMTGAINNIGIIELPNKQKIYIAVFVHNTTEEFSKGEEIIADIAKVTWDYYIEKNGK